MAAPRSTTDLLRELASHPPEVLREILERERALQGQIAGRVFAPIDVIFDLLEQSGTALREQAVALEEAGRALTQAGAVMKAQADLFERTIGALREPTELAKTVAGAPKRPRRKRTA